MEAVLGLLLIVVLFAFGKEVIGHLFKSIKGVVSFIFILWLVVFVLTHCG